MRNSLLAGVAGVVAIASAAPAAVVTFSVVNTGGGTFNVVATDSTDAGNFGIAAYGFDLAGFTTLNKAAPQASFIRQQPASFVQAGFFLLGSQSDAATSGGAQDTVNLSNGIIITGVGQQAGDVRNSRPSGYSDFEVSQAAYGYPVVLATGTFRGALPTLVRASASVLNTSNGRTTTTATVVLPEPAGLIFAGLVGLLAVRRRRA